MIDRADAVVIGSGALGAATAWHLAAAGRRVVLVDQHAIGSQTSARAAGLSAQVRHSALMTRLAVRGVEKLLSFTAETGEPLEVRRVGSLKVARTPAHAGQLEAEAARGRELGVETGLVSREEARRLMPFLEPAGATAISFTPGDVYLEPEALAPGYARSAARLGCELLPHTRVEAVVVDGGEVAGVRTSRGEIRAPVVVDAAGGWARRVAALAGAALPLVATRHQLLITGPIEGVRPEQPITRVVDANVYVRPCRGGLMLGGYEADPLQVTVEELPPDYSIDDMPLDEGVLRRLAARVAAEFPVFRDARAAVVRGGLPTMTPDDEHVVGPVPGVIGLLVVAGCNVGGLSTAPAFGELVATMALGRDVPPDIAPLLPARFLGRSFGEAGLRELCRAHYAFHYWSASSRAAAGGAAPPG